MGVLLPELSCVSLSICRMDGCICGDTGCFILIGGGGAGLVGTVGLRLGVLLLELGCLCMDG